MKAFEQLVALVEGAKVAIGVGENPYNTRILSARAIPDQRVNSLKRVEPSVSYYGSKLTEEEALAFGRAKAIAIERERAEGERQRAAKLREIAADLEAWRTVIPDLAARACIELGVVARDLNKEASR